VITIPRFTVHEYGRADSVHSSLSSDVESKSAKSDEAGEEEDGRGVDLILKEWIDPANGEQGILFGNVVGSILDRDPDVGLIGNVWMLWGLFVIFWEWDNFPRLVKMPRLWGIGKMVERAVSWGVLGVTMGLGRWFGMRVL
jgi:hypothetical protein